VLTLFCAELRVEASRTRRFGVVTTPDFVTRPTEMLTEKTISDLTSGSASGGGSNLKSPLYSEFYSVHSKLIAEHDKTVEF
jgi:hypothetical protein